MKRFHLKHDIYLCVSLCLLSGSLCNKKEFKNLHRVTQSYTEDHRGYTEGNDIKLYLCFKHKTINVSVPETRCQTTPNTQKHR
jgi:hypothetical protein